MFKARKKANFIKKREKRVFIYINTKPEAKKGKDNRMSMCVSK